MKIIFLYAQRRLFYVVCHFLYSTPRQFPWLLFTLDRRCNERLNGGTNGNLYCEVHKINMYITHLTLFFFFCNNFISFFNFSSSSYASFYVFIVILFKHTKYQLIIMRVHKYFAPRRFFLLFFIILFLFLKITCLRFSEEFEWSVLCDL